MTAKTQTVELDEATAATLKSRAAERGVSVSQVVAELVPLALGQDEIAELDRRWAAAKNGPTASHDDVERWLETWGTPAFRPWRDR